MLGLGLGLTGTAIIIEVDHNFPSPPASFVLLIDDHVSFSSTTPCPLLGEDEAIIIEEI
jgi:hypothetical protein